jgi:hypothetical protein
MVSDFGILPMRRLEASNPNSTSINATTVSLDMRFAGSLDVTVIDLFCLPFLFFVLNVTEISPSPPGGIAVFVRTAAVHPHDPLALINRSGASPVLRTMNV